MADTLTSTNEVKVDLLFQDGDDRTITMKNPKETITNEQILALEELIMNGDQTESLLIGDKYGSDFRRIETVTKVKKTTTNLDISQ